VDVLTKTIKELQKYVDKFISQYKNGYWPPYIMLAALMEEVGELSREINHLRGMKPKKNSEEENEIKIEMGDLLFSLICIANEFEIDLSDALENTLNKYDKRDNRRWNKK
jgi:NTP pyrophosphatase (non-canonical NTP hydrolase)